MYEMDRERSDSGMGMFAVGALCGAAIGAALGLLYAPRSGAETRSQLAMQSRRIGDRVTEQAGAIRERAGEVYQGASHTMNDIIARGREAMDVGREAFNRARPHNGSASDMG